MDADRLLQPGVLGVDDALQERRHQVYPGDLLPEREERQRQPLSLLGHAFGQAVSEIGLGLDDEAGSAHAGESRDEVDLSRGIVANREAGRKQEVAGPCLARRVRRLDDADPFDPALQAGGAADQKCLVEAAQLHRLTHGGAGHDRVVDLSFSHLGA